MFCAYCGKEISDDALFCGHCGTKTRRASPAPVPPAPPSYYNAPQTSAGNAGYPPAGYKPKKKLTALLLLIFLGGWGAHRFYTGKIGTAIFMLSLSILNIIFWLFFLALFNDGDYTSGFFAGIILYGYFNYMFISFLVIIISIGLFIWCFIDFIKICVGKFNDNKGYQLI